MTIDVPASPVAEEDAKGLDAAGILTPMCVQAQVLHKRSYGNTLLFLDLHVATSLTPEQIEDASRSDDAGRGLEAVLATEVYGPTVRAARKDISPGDVVEFQGSLRACGRILEVVSYRMVERWQDASGGAHFNATSLSPPDAHKAKERIASRTQKLKPEEVDAATGLQLCKFWICNNDCQKLGCECAHPEGTDLKDARSRFAKMQMERKARNANPDDPHSADGKKNHAQRAAVFAEWLCTEFGLEQLRKGGVVEIAGGRGELAFELSVKRRVPCIVVDPRCPGEEMQLSAWKDFRISRPQMAWLKKQMPELKGTHAYQAVVASSPLRQCSCFVKQEDIDLASPNRSWWSTVVESCSVVVGFHPDQATGAVVDLAIAFGKPFAVVPCCTFADDFPDRRLATGEPVRTYDDLVNWLKSRATGTSVSFLGFQGKNLAVHAKPAIGDASRCADGGPSPNEE